MYLAVVSMYLAELPSSLRFTVESAKLKRPGKQKKGKEENDAATSKRRNEGGGGGFSLRNFLKRRSEGTTILNEVNSKHVSLRTGEVETA
jgi:hypothetical protein